MRGDLATPVLVYILPQFILNSAILLLDLQSPSYVRLGDSTKLVCVYDLEYDGFYSLKWYKDGSEFYSYIPKLSSDPRRFFNVTGVQLDRLLSDHQQVVLHNISLDSSGEYKCQVSGEGPLFATYNQVKTLRVAIVPTGPPVISELPARYHPGDWLNLNCTSGKSNPPVRLTWFVNGKEAEYGMIRTFESIYPTVPIIKSEQFPRFSNDSSFSIATHQSEYDTEEISNRTKQVNNKVQDLELYSSVLGLQFWVHEEHYENGKLVVQCKAEISEVFSNQTENYIVGEHTVGTDKALLAISSSRDLSPSVGNFLLFLQAILLQIVPFM